VANHKKKRPISRRSHCKLCKPWKVNGVRTESEVGEKFSDHARRTSVGKDIYFNSDASDDSGDYVVEVFTEYFDVKQPIVA
jgi:hypothetical protein